MCMDWSRIDYDTLIKGKFPRDVVLQGGLECCKDKSWKHTYGIAEVEGRLWVFSGCRDLFNGTKDKHHYNPVLTGFQFPSLAGGKLV